MTDTAAPLALHPDRLLPADPGVRAIARRLYASVRELPVISPHGHVDPACFSTTSRSAIPPGETLGATSRRGCGAPPLE